MKKNKVWELKIWDNYFRDVESGLKTFEIRKYNEKYQVDDIIKFINNLTGKKIKKKIIYLNHTQNIYPCNIFSCTNLTILGLGEMDEKK